MGNEHEDVIAKIAKRNKTIIEEDDPILILLTLYDHAMAQSEARQQQRDHEFNQVNEAALGRLNQAMAEKLEEWEKTANTKASRLINVSLEQNREQINAEKRRFFSELDTRLAQQQTLTTEAAEKLRKAALFNLASISTSLLIVGITIAILFW